MSLLDLPAELLDAICQQCQVADIRNLRLCCQALRSVATDHFLKDISIYYTMDSLRKCIDIASDHPELAQNVQSVWFQADRLELLDSFEAWNKARQEEFGNVLEEYANIPPESPAKRGTFDKAALQARYQIYRRLLSEQDKIDQGPVLAKSLTKFFQASPNLSEIWFTLAQAFTTRRNKTEDNLTFRPGLICPFGDFRSDHHDGMHALTELLTAVYNSKRHIHTLVVAEVSHFFLRTPVSGPIPHVMSNLRRLEFHIAQPWSKDEGLPEEFAIFDLLATFQYGMFRKFIKHAVNLRVLVLELPYGAPSERVPFSHVLGTRSDYVKFPYLESFSIRYVEADPEDLAAFILGHKDKLKRLALSDLRNCGAAGAYLKMFKQLAGNLPIIEHVKLLGWFQCREDRSDDDAFYFSHTGESKHRSKYEKELSDYIKFGGEVVPEQHSDNELTEDDGEYSEADDHEIKYLGESESEAEDG